MKKMFLPLIFFYCVTLHAQSSFWNNPQAYLGQTPPDETPVRFAPGLLVVKDSFDMDRVAFSADGKEFYYETNNTWYSTDPAVLRSFEYKDGRWVGPTTLFRRYFTPWISADQQTMYLSGGTIRDSLHAYVFKSQRKPGGGWTEPTVFLKEPYALYMFAMTESGVGYVGSKTKDGAGGMDVCTMHFSGGDTTIASLGAPINTPGWNGDFYVAPDESYIIVSANETKDFECELYISFRRPDHSWTAPVSLGPLINDGLAHRWGEYVTPDGKYLFYTRATGPENCHLYWVRFDKLLARMRKQAGLVTR